MKINLPPKKDLTLTSWDDPLKYYYLPIASFFYRRRLKDILTLLGVEKYKHLLEIGFGSGIFLPELSKRCENLYGLEIHKKIDEVNNFLSKNGIKAGLIRGDVLKMPYKDNFFDAIISVSTLEHIKDLDCASDEILRVLKPGGMVILGFPVRNKFTDAIFRIFGNDPREIHPSSHQDILRIFNERMNQDKIIYLPNFFPHFMAMYVSVKFSKK